MDSIFLYETEMIVINNTRALLFIIIFGHVRSYFIFENISQDHKYELRKFDFDTFYHYIS